MATTINSNTTDGIVITPDTSGEIELQADGVTKAKITANGLQDANGASLRGGMYRNLIINGDMQIAQRGTSVTGITSSDYHVMDRFRTNIMSAGTWTIAQDTDVPSGQGFSNSIKLDCTTANASLSSNELVHVLQRIEAQNLQHLKFGTSNAESLTASFWVKSNKTGTYTLTFIQPDGSNKMLAKSYTINSADTWEKKTITIEGDIAGQIDNNNDVGLNVYWQLAVGPSRNSGGINTSWTAYNISNEADSSQVNLADSTSNYINITGVQLEVGEGASDFEFLPYDVQLARCQRYYETFYLEWYPVSYSNAFRGGRQYFRVFKRATPTGSVKSGTITYALLGIYTVSANSNTGLNIVETNDGFFISHSRQAGGTAPTNGMTYFNETAVTLQFDAEL